MAVKEKGVAGMEQAQKVRVGLDMPDERILQLNADKGIELEWDEREFRELKEDVVRRLVPGNMKRYLEVEVGVRERAKRAAGTVKVSNPFNPLGNNAEYRLRVRKRRGWHQCWKSPGMELDEALAGPYRQVRRQKEGESAEPGEENGEVLKLMDENGKVELVAVECPQEMFEGYLEWMAEESSSRFRSNKERYFESVEEINRNVKDKDHRMVPIDASGEVRA